MKKTSLILVDGICGSGKSTLAQRICLALEREGVSARWIFEHEVPHPLCGQDMTDALDAGVLVPGLYRAALERWRQLAAELDGTRRVVIVESMMFQVYAGLPLLLGMKKARIMAHAAEVEKAVACLNPRLVYLYQPDVAVALEAICRKRGDWFRDLLAQKLAKAPNGKWRGAGGTVGVVNYFRDLRSMTETILGRLKMPVLRVNTGDGDYERCNREVEKFLLLPKGCLAGGAGAAVTGATAAKICGTYRASTGSDTMLISSVGGRLYLGEPGGLLLLRTAVRRFVVQGLCMEIRFGQRGTTRYLECSGNLPGLCRLWRKT